MRCLSSGDSCSRDREAHRARQDHLNHTKIINSTTLFLLAVSLILVSVIMTVLFYNDYGVLKTLGICVVWLVASIPIAMQVVCTSTMALGSHALGERQAIVYRLASIEELA